MVYESSYESGHRPFTPDSNRGKWSSPKDFIFICIGLAFKLDTLSVDLIAYNRGGIFIALPYTVFMFLYVVPLVVVHTFMGQFSSSGFISALRLSPIFKGMGYVALVMNYFVLTFYTIFAMVPLFMFLSSLNPTLPWSCEAAANWSFNVTTPDFYHICDKNVTVEEPTTEPTTDIHGNITSSYNYTYTLMHVPSILYFEKHFENKDVVSLDDSNMKISWTLLACAITVWVIIAAIFYKFNTPEKLGKILRYMIWSAIGAMLIVLVVLHFLDSSSDTFDHFILPQNRLLEEYAKSTLASPLMSLCAFGAGWGSIISFASFNNFKSDIMQQSWLIGCGQMLIVVILGWLSLLVENEINYLTHEDMIPNYEPDWLLLTASGSVLSTMKFGNLWCLLLYGMLLLGALAIMISQLLSLLVTIFDEFESLREHKMEVTMSIIGSLSLLSIFFCCTHGVFYFDALAMDSTFTQIALNLLLLLVVLWIYGRVRFQRDIQFMLGKPFATWKIYSLRILAPLALLFCMLCSLLVASYEHYYNFTVILVAGLIMFFVLPWLFIPSYAIFHIVQTTGTLRQRWKRCCSPTDWYPVDTDDRQRYEEAMGNMDITHQLQEIRDEEVP